MSSDVSRLRRVWIWVRPILAVIAVGSLLLFFQYTRSIEGRVERLIQSGDLTAAARTLRSTLNWSGTNRPLLIQYLRVLAHQHKLDHAYAIHEEYTRRVGRDLTEVLDTLLVAAIHDSSPTVAATAIRAGSVLNLRHLLPAIESCAVNRKSPVRTKALQALPRLTDTSTYRLLHEQAHDPDPLVREAALLAIARLGDPRSLAQLKGDDALTRLVRAELGDSAQVRRLRRDFGSLSGVAAIHSAAALVRAGSPQYVSALLQVETPDPTEREELAERIADLEATAGIPVLLSYIADPYPGVRRAAAEALGRFATTDRSLLIGLTRDPEPEVRAAALVSLAQLGPEEALPWLRAASADRDLRVRVAALAGITRSYVRSLTTLE